MENPALDSSFPQDECKQHVGLALIESIQLQPFTLISFNVLKEFYLIYDIKRSY
jgi:hypothetical protein